VDWQFTAAEARTKLKRLYPVIVMSEEETSLQLGTAAALPPAKPEARGKTQSRRRGSLSVQKAARVSNRTASPVIVHGSTT
jgi:hypothetical protein